METKDSLIWVVGVPRSGTTLVAAALAGGAGHKLRPEFTIGTRIIQLYRDIKDFADEARKQTYFGSDDDLRLAFSKLVLGAADRAREGRKGLFVLKDPELTKYVQILPEMFGASPKIVVVVRDPVCSSQSLRQVRLRQGRDVSLISCAEEIQPYLNAAAEALAVQRLDSLLVRYEDFVRKFDETAARLKLHTGIQPFPGFKEELDFITASDPFFSNLYGRSIQEDRARSQDNDEYNMLKDWFQRTSRNALSRLGYL